MLDVFSPDDTRAAMADWVELTLAMGTRRAITDAAVVRGDEAIEDDLDAGRDGFDAEAGEDGETIDREILDTETEKRRDDMWEELAYRQEALGELYPFVLSKKGATNWQLTLRDASTPQVALAHHVYLGALVMAAFRQGHIKKQKRDRGQFTRLEKKIAGQFQHLAAYAVATLLGQAYSFGWPRPDKSKFRDAAVDAMACLGLGKVRDDFPLDSTGSEKDGTVDVIGWHAFRDRAFGALVLYGQVASGKNWTSKPIGTYLDEKFLRYLDPAPSKHYIGATIMPFLLHSELTEPPHGDWPGARQSRAQGLEMTHGTLIDRLRLTELLGEGLPEVGRLHNCVEPEQALKALAAWVKSCRVYCDKAA
ncbi:hypothetical protein DT076_07100 [Desertihabitans brevis]|uniref:Uncharacterized protein n=1 Tax=Desertihabitans brevis TaxID=2268447 RepID=A0A367YX54_9ACTN|nr:hypothetical protein [Desertihabitans brevis]RCK70408.1 hypothetical protein DT076_07100 [Desertihabitans brevis]